MNSTERRRSSASRSWASAIVARTSATPDITALRVAELGADRLGEEPGEATSCRCPGGPHRRSDARWPRATRPAERPALADEVRLAHELLERPRAHPGREGLPLGRRLEQGLGRAPETARRVGMGRW